MRLYIVRHAQCLSNVLFSNGEADLFDDPITETGVLQTQALATHFAHLQRGGVNPIIAVYSSPLQRALQTAYPISRAVGVPLQVWTELYEYKAPEVKREGMSWQAIDLAFPDVILPEHVPDDHWWQVADDTTFADCYTRGQRVAERLREQAEIMIQAGQRAAILVITHLVFADVLVRAIANLAPESTAHPFFYHQNAGITQIQYLDERQRRYVNDAPTALLALNGVEHLSSEIRTPEPGM